MIPRWGVAMTNGGWRLAGRTKRSGWAGQPSALGDRRVGTRPRATPSDLVAGAAARLMVGLRGDVDAIQALEPVTRPVKSLLRPRSGLLAQCEKDYLPHATDLVK